MPRPRQWDHCDEIARLIGQGRSIKHTADALDLSRGIVVNRLASMRSRLADVSGDLEWLSASRRTHVEVARAWLELGPIEGA